MCKRGDGYRGDEARFVFKACNESRFGDLDCNLPSQARIGGAEYLAHAAMAERRVYFVRSQPGSRRYFRVRETRDQVRGALIEQLVPAIRVLRQELFNFAAYFGIRAGESFLAGLAGRVV